MHCSRNTIRRHLKLQSQCQPVVYGPRAQRAGKLAPFEGYLRQGVKAARPHWMPAIVLLREIREQGYEHGYSILTSFLLTLKTKAHEASFVSKPSLVSRCRWNSPLFAAAAIRCWHS